VLDGGVLERRVMRLLDARVRWRVVSAVGCVAVMGLVCAAGAVVEWDLCLGKQ